MAPVPPTQSQIPKGVKLSAAQVAQHARTAGFPESEIAMTVAVAYLESGWDPNREGEIDPRDKGLMQINSHYHPEVLQINWRNPQENMNLAFRIWQTRGWGEWHTAGAARLVRNRADIVQAVASSHSVGDIAGVAASAVGDATGLKDIANAVKFFTVGRNWARIGEMVLGGALLLIALNILARPITQPVIKVAAKATPAGEALGAFGHWK